MNINSKSLLYSVISIMVTLIAIRNTVIRSILDIIGKLGVINDFKNFLASSFFTCDLVHNFVIVFLGEIVRFLLTL